MTALNEPVLAFVLRHHYSSPSNLAMETVLAAVDKLEEYRSTNERLVNEVEMAMVKAGNAGIPMEALDDFRVLAKEMGEL